MLGTVMSSVASLIKMKLDIQGRIRAMTVTAALMLVGIALMLVAAGFGLALLYVWLQSELGTMAALAIIAGGALVLALILFAIAVWRPKPGSKPVHRPPPPPPQAAQSTTGSTTTDRMLDEAITTMQHGSRESMLAALSLALVTGVILGRRM